MRFGNGEGVGKETWLLRKEADSSAVTGAGRDILETRTESVKSGRRI